ncbi:hypothetical protein L7F22_060825 [Adiantum nelumboides]|nr:hypothetical protein [Adiantum nelumboides]
MITLGYARRFQSDANVYNDNTFNTLLFLAIYVDDILLISNSHSALDAAKAELSSSFSMTDMGAVHYCLGIQVFQHPSTGVIKISQQSYIKSLLQKYHMFACKGVETPHPTTLKLHQSDVTSTLTADLASFPYANILGGI